MTPDPSRERRSAAVALAASAAFAAGYLLVKLAHPPTLLYDPLGRRWWVARSAPPPVMDFFGQVAWALASALVAGLLAALLLRRRDPSPRLVRGLFALTLLLVLAQVVRLGWTLFG